MHETDAQYTWPQAYNKMEVIQGERIKKREMCGGRWGGGVSASFIHRCRTWKKRGGKRTLEKQTTHSNEQSHTGNCSVTCSCELILLYYTESGSIGHSFRGEEHVTIIMCFPFQWSVTQSAVVCNCSFFPPTVGNNSGASAVFNNAAKIRWSTYRMFREQPAAAIM